MCLDNSTMRMSVKPSKDLWHLCEIGVRVPQTNIDINFWCNCQTVRNGQQTLLFLQIIWFHLHVSCCTFDSPASQDQSAPDGCAGVFSTLWDLPVSTESATSVELGGWPTLLSPGPSGLSAKYCVCVKEEVSLLEVICTEQETTLPVCFMLRTSLVTTINQSWPGAKLK